MNDEPEIDEEVGGPTSARVTRRHEKPSLFNTKFREIAGYEFWITPYNRIFLVNPAGTLTYPRLSGSRRTKHDLRDAIVLDPPWEGIPIIVLGELLMFLEKQDAVRSRMIKEGEYDEDDACWECF